MAKGKVYFWTAPGVVQIDGKEYGAEMPLPIDSVDPKRVKRWIKEGKIGEKIAPIVAECADCSGLEKEIKSLEKKVKKLSDKKGDCDDCAKLQNQVNELDSENKRLTGEAEGLQDDIKEKKALIEKLETAAKEADKGGK